MKYYAHFIKDLEQYQTNEDHLINVGKIAKDFAQEFNAEHFGYVSGLLHDVGKNSVEFQKRLLENGKIVDHSTAGAKIAIKYFNNALGTLLGYVICGHHAGLMDYGSAESGLYWRLKKSIPEFSFNQNLFQINPEILLKKMTEEVKDKLYSGFSLAFFIRMIYSCLVDADYLDTESFMKCFDLKHKQYSFDKLHLKFNQHMEKLEIEAEKNSINQLRKQIASDCIEAAYQNTNLFTLTVPTGGGKTLASMAFALNHLKHNNLKRIIYVIPYTSIIEQNAAVYKEIFGMDNVLEHHSNFDIEETKTESFSTIDKIKKAAENWDIPIVVTTNVQFFESLFSNKSSRCRKLHNIANSVVILDEAQMLPINYLKPSLAAIEELVKHYHASVVLCTATKPEFTSLLSTKPTEIIKEPEYYYNLLKRIEIVNLGLLSDDELTEKILQHHQVLTIVNTRNHCQQLFAKIKAEKNVFHLSAKMCPVHRSIVIKNIRNLLEKNQPCRIISTQLIECGVDISFPVIYRVITGIDSIAQAAGRCNREGKLDKGIVYIFESTEKYGKPIMFQNRAAVHGKAVIRKYQADSLSLEAISEYFHNLFNNEDDNLDKKRLINNFEEGHSFLGYKFETTSMDYKIIEAGESLIIPFDDAAKEIVKALEYTELSSSYLRKLQPYTISIYKQQLMSLLYRGYVRLVADRFYVLAVTDEYESYYDSQTGLIIDANEFLYI
ncbi:MAG: CRISPR-associated helicase Cas3' [Bacilli bacterium]|nr:CRISPR-associated helicase Cas3' [Bacilli bacterium]MDD4388940.1 CRISPR-associated helicase Cas3' [Bacilli bacterium]